MNTLAINRSSPFSIDKMFQTLVSKRKSFYVFFVFVISKCNAFVMIVFLPKQDWTLFLNYIKSTCSTLQTPMNVHHIKSHIKLTSVKNKLGHHVTCITFWWGQVQQIIQTIHCAKSNVIHDTHAFNVNTKVLYLSMLWHNECWFLCSWLYLVFMGSCVLCALTKH